MILNLLRSFEKHKRSDEHVEFIVTINTPEDCIGVLRDFVVQSAIPVRLIENEMPLGFGANHNQAYLLSSGKYFCVINPDVLLMNDPWRHISTSFSSASVGLVYPCQKHPDMTDLDYERALTTPWTLFKRHLFRSNFRGFDFHWVSGAFMVFRSEVFSHLKGFDEKFFLYCEDVDICLRLQLAGYSMQRADFSVIHDTRRGTLRKWDHFKWHVASLLKLWCSRTFWVYLWNRHKIRQR